MDFGDLQVKHTQMYRIIDKNLHYDPRKDEFTYAFLLQNEQMQIKTDKLEHVYINDLFEWQKSKEPDIHYESFGITAEESQEEGLFIQTGILSIKKTKLGKEKKAQVNAKRYVYNLKVYH